MKIDGEQAYPVYDFDIRWVEDGEHKPDGLWRQKGLRKGRVWNQTCNTRMYKKEKTVAELRKDGMATYRYHLKDKGNIKNPSRPEIKVELVHHEIWCPRWFCHWTFNIGQTDKEALDSFEKFVRRMENQNWKNGHSEHHRVDGNTEPYYELMGAEDRWRWSGGQDKDHLTAPPCRCKYCKEQGKIRINH